MNQQVYTLIVYILGITTQSEHEIVIWYRGPELLILKRSFFQKEGNHHMSGKPMYEHSLN